MTSALEGGEWSAARPGRTLPPGKTRYPLYRKLGGPQGHVRKISPPTGFDPRSVQPVVSRYTDWATGPTFNLCSGLKTNLLHSVFRNKILIYFSSVSSVLHASLLPFSVIWQYSVKCLIWRLSVYFLVFDLYTFKTFVLFAVTPFTPKSDRTYV
jgi:hypothetical protein